MPVYWFKPKRYGYGATPVTWQGWALTGGSVAAIVAAALLIRPAESFLFWIIAVAIAAIFCAITYRKTEGGWRWRWGDR